MGRKTIVQILSESQVDVIREYDRLYNMFYDQLYPGSFGKNTTLRNHCAQHFMEMPFRDTCISLDDFERTNGFIFQARTHADFSEEWRLERLLRLCEYSYNVAFYSQELVNTVYSMTLSSEPYAPIENYLQQVERVIDKIGYMPNTINGVTEFVAKDQIVFSISQTLDASLSYKLIDYNHHSMQGDLKRKRETLLLLADKLEAEEKQLKQINSSLADDLFFMLNNLNIRHNNAKKGGKYYKAFIASMTPEELEKWYDEVYQVCLLAFMELENKPRKQAIADLKKSISNTK